MNSYCSKKCWSWGTRGDHAWRHGQVRSGETCAKISASKSGKNHPNYGRHLPDETRRKISENNKGKHFDRSGKTYVDLYGDRASEVSAKISASNKGRVISDETRARMSAALTGKKNPPSWFAKMQGRKLSAEHIKKTMRRRIPTSLEEKFMEIADRNNLPYAYVGDGSLVIDRYNPDFVNVNGQKILVEVYARMYKTLGNRTIEDWRRERERTFAKYGYQTFFFDEVELTEQNVLNALSQRSN